MSEPSIELIGGREGGYITIVPYDPAWVKRFDLERERIEKALSSAVRRIEHIGSTAVPGLAAKPIIDIIVVLDEADDEAAYRPQLEAAGYVLRVREPGHRMFRTPERDVHVHLWSDSSEIERHLLFRDWLCANASDRRLYETVKRELAKREWADKNLYAEAKSDVIAEISARARVHPS